MENEEQMEIVHSLGILSLKKNAYENAGFLLTNKKGSYCSFFSSTSSRYHGLFYFDANTMEMYKLIESIELGINQISSLKNGFYFAERRKHNVVESFLMPKGFNSLIYELSSEKEVDLLLDCKKSYDNREWGRHYNIFEKDGCIVVEFTKKTDKREDASNGVDEFSLYLAIKSDSNSYQKNGKWVERHYDFDEQRNSRPYFRYVYNALRLKGSKFVFSMSKDRKNAVRECLHVFSSLNEVKSKEKEYFFELLKNEQIEKTIKNDSISNEIKIAYINAFNSLNNLIVDAKNFGIFAGFPWFFQFWSRDSLISLKALSNVDKESAKKLMSGYLSQIGNDGRLPNLTGKRAFIGLGNADAHGWLFLRCNELVEKINKNKETIALISKSMSAIDNKSLSSEKIKEYLKRCSSIIKKKEDEYDKAVYEIEASLEKSFVGLQKFHTRNSFEFNEKLETWMDTSFESNAREGIRLEIQALRLNIYKLMFELTQDHKYKALENILKAKVRDNFWNGKILADGLEDFTVRPNIFIAAYAYPDLLAIDEWEKCFDNALKSLWLDWGGLSTIDKNNELFTAHNTGEDNRSYHRGDSWFWLNNLAALVLNRINKNKFRKDIQKIIAASAEEILWKGCIGCHSELSSAKQLESNGCFNQAWSNAMFIEMVDEIFESSK